MVSATDIDYAPQLIPTYRPDEWDLHASLWTDRSWMVRRVDRVSIVDRERVQLSITFTIDNRVIQNLLEKYGYEVSRSLQIPLPLFLWKKEPVLDVDVRSDSGRRLPVVTRDQSTYFAQSILMSGVEIDDLIATDSGRIQFASFMTELHALLAQNKPSHDLDALPDEIGKTILNSKGREFTQSEKQRLNRILYWIAFSEKVTEERIREFVNSYIFMTRVEIDPSIDVQVIHCRFVYKNKFKLDRPSFGRATYHYDILATGFDTLDERVHVRLEAPAGTRIVEVCPIIQNRNQEKVVYHDAKEILQSVLTSNLVELVRSRMTISDNDRSVDDFIIRIRLIFMPRRSAFLTPSFFLSLAYFCCLVTVVSLLCFDRQATPPFTGITGLLAIGAAFLTRDLQHDISSHVSERTRWAFGVVSALVFISSFLTGINASSGFPYCMTVSVALVALVCSGIYALNTGVVLYRMRARVTAGCQLR